MEHTDNTKPLVSILIPTHERPHYFSLALASVISQTYPNIEIVISDNSMDNDTETIVNNFREKYTNIKYFHTPGLDMWGNWQKCWDNMSDDSQYVNFLMDDDIFAPTKIEKMVEQFISNPSLSLVTSYRMMVDKEGAPLPDGNFNKPITTSPTIIDGKKAGKYLLINCLNWIGEPTTVLFNRSLTDGFFKGWTGDEKYLILDYPLWLRLLKKGDMFYIPEPLSFFRQHEVNDSKDFTTNVKGAISMALAIRHAWNNRIYIETEEELKNTIFSWLKLSLGIIDMCYADNYSGREFDDLLLVCKELCNAYTSRNVGMITYEF